MLAEEYLARYFPSIRQALEQGKFGVAGNGESSGLFDPGAQRYGASLAIIGVRPFQSRAAATIRRRSLKDGMGAVVSMGLRGLHAHLCILR